MPKVFQKEFGLAERCTEFSIQLSKRDGEKGMKIVAFCGSPRQQGNTYLLQKAILAILADAGAETELVELAGSKMRGCMSCYVCFLEKNGTCVLKKKGAAVVAVRRSGAVHTLYTMNHFFSSEQDDSLSDQAHGMLESVQKKAKWLTMRKV